MRKDYYAIRTLFFFFFIYSVSLGFCAFSTPYNGDGLVQAWLVIVFIYGKLLLSCYEAKVPQLHIPDNGNFLFSVNYKFYSHPIWFQHQVLAADCFFFLNILISHKE